MKTAAVALIFNERGEILACPRKEDRARLAVPGGKIEVGESAYGAVMREVREETGLKLRPEELIPMLAVTLDDGGYYTACFLLRRSLSLETVFLAEAPGLDPVWVTPEALLEVTICPVWTRAALILAGLHRSGPGFTR